MLAYSQAFAAGIVCGTFACLGGLMCSRESAGKWLDLRLRDRWGQMIFSGAQGRGCLAG
jgi:hypothetical protein